MAEKSVGYLARYMAEKRVDSTALTTDAPTNLGIHLAAMSASLKQKDALRAACSAY